MAPVAKPLITCEINQCHQILSLEILETLKNYEESKNWHRRHGKHG